MPAPIRPVGNELVGIFEDGGYAAMGLSPMLQAVMGDPSVSKQSQHKNVNVIDARDADLLHRMWMEQSDNMISQAVSARGGTHLVVSEDIPDYDILRLKTNGLAVGTGRNITLTKKGDKILRDKILTSPSEYHLNRTKEKFDVREAKLVKANKNPWMGRPGIDPPPPGWEQIQQINKDLDEIESLPDRQTITSAGKALLSDEGGKLLLVDNSTDQVELWEQSSPGQGEKAIIYPDNLRDGKEYHFSKPLGTIRDILQKNQNDNNGPKILAMPRKLRKITAARLNRPGVAKLNRLPALQKLNSGGLKTEQEYIALWHQLLSEAEAAGVSIEATTYDENNSGKKVVTHPLSLAATGEPIEDSSFYAERTYYDTGRLDFNGRFT